MPVAAPGPVRVVLVDAHGEGDVPEISPDRAGGGSYDTARVFAARHGRLVGEVQVALHGRVVSPDELSGHIRRVLGQDWLAGRGPVQRTGLPLISVVIATTMERVDELERCLESLLALDYPDFEVIFVDNRPETSPARAKLHARLREDRRVRVVDEPRRGISAARNHGARVARGSVVAFTDDDAVVHPLWLRGIGTRMHAEPDVGCVSGVVLPAELETPAQIWFERSGSKLALRYRAASFHNDGTWSKLRFGSLRRARFENTTTVDDVPDLMGEQELPAGSPKHLVYRAGAFGMGANIAFRTDALRSVGWFDETLGTGTPARGGEDIAALARLLHRGGRITMDPAVIVLHYHRSDYASSRTQMYGYGVGATAAIASLIRADPRHLVGLLYLVRPALRVLTGKSADRKADNYPGELARIELRGFIVGPFAYLRSVLAHARMTRRLSRSSRRTSRPGTGGTGSDGS